jgi:hypothetical protein
LLGGDHNGVKGRCSKYRSTTVSAAALLGGDQGDDQGDFHVGSLFNFPKLLQQTASQQQNEEVGPPLTPPAKTRSFTKPGLGCRHLATSPHCQHV